MSVAGISLPPGEAGRGQSPEVRWRAPGMTLASRAGLGLRSTLTRIFGAGNEPCVLLRGSTSKRPFKVCAMVAMAAMRQPPVASAKTPWGLARATTSTNTRTTYLEASRPARSCRESLQTESLQEKCGRSPNSSEKASDLATPVAGNGQRRN